MVRVSPMTIKTYTGRRWHLSDPRSADVDVKDIAHALSNQCRFNGHVTCFYSVAQHAVIVALEVFRRTGDYRLAFWGLHHDDEETYLGDVVKPLKRLAQSGAHRDLAELTQTAVLDYLGLSWPEPPVVKLVDRLVLRTEQRDLMAPWADGSDELLEGALDHLKLHTSTSGHSDSLELWERAFDHTQELFEGYAVWTQMHMLCMGPHASEKYFLQLHKFLRKKLFGEPDTFLGGKPRETA